MEVSVEFTSSRTSRTFDEAVGLVYASRGWVMLNGCDVTGTSDPELADSLYPAPNASSARSTKVARPSTAASEVAPRSVAAPGFTASCTCTVAVEWVTFPKWSRMPTCTAGVNARLIDVSCGSTTKESDSSAAGETVNWALVAAVRPLADALSV